MNLVKGRSPSPPCRAFGTCPRVAVRTGDAPRGAGWETSDAGLGTGSVRLSRFPGDDRVIGGGSHKHFDTLLWGNRGLRLLFSQLSYEVPDRFQFRLQFDPILGLGFVDCLPRVLVDELLDGPACDLA